MNEHDAVETAYKNGYEAGVKDFAEEFKKRCLEKGIFPVVIKNILKNLVIEMTEGK